MISSGTVNKTKCDVSIGRRLSVIAGAGLLDSSDVNADDEAEDALIC